MQRLTGAQKRLKVELKALEADPPVDCSAGPVDDDDWFRWRATIVGPPDSSYPYEDFVLDISFPDHYPFKPPEVRFTEQVILPKVDRNGLVTLDMLKDHWSPSISMSQVLRSISDLLYDRAVVEAALSEQAVRRTSAGPTGKSRERTCADFSTLPYTELLRVLQEKAVTEPARMPVFHTRRGAARLAAGSNTTMIAVGSTAHVVDATFLDRFACEGVDAATLFHVEDIVDDAEEIRQRCAHWKWALMLVGSGKTAAHAILRWPKRWELCYGFPPFPMRMEGIELVCAAQAGRRGLTFDAYSDLFGAARCRAHERGVCASLPGGFAYAAVQGKLEEANFMLGLESLSTVWFGDTPVFGVFCPQDCTWEHPVDRPCGRDDVQVPPKTDDRHPMWDEVESARGKKPAEEGVAYPCWCCKWLQKVDYFHDKGCTIYACTSNIFLDSWVGDQTKKAASSEVEGEELRQVEGEPLRRLPEGWGTGLMTMQLNGKDTDFVYRRKAEVHPDTGRPLGVGCRWERKALNHRPYEVKCFFLP